MEVEHVVGPVLSEQEYFRICGKDLSARTVDVGHMKSATEKMSRIENNITSSSSSSLPKKIQVDVDDLASRFKQTLSMGLQRLEKGSAERTAVYALSRTESSTTITAQFSFDPTKAEKGNSEYAYVQYIVRMEGLSPYDRARYERRRAGLRLLIVYCRSCMN